MSAEQVALTVLSAASVPLAALASAGAVYAAKLLRRAASKSETKVDDMIVKIVEDAFKRACERR